jgi:hypothetical protein
VARFGVVSFGVRLLGRLSRTRPRCGPRVVRR